MRNRGTVRVINGEAVAKRNHRRIFLNWCWKRCARRASAGDVEASGAMTIVCEMSCGNEKKRLVGAPGGRNADVGS